MRPIVYPHTDIFLVCFSVVMPASLMNIQNQWVHEITKYCPNTPFILVCLLINTQQNNYMRLFFLCFHKSLAPDLIEFFWISKQFHTWTTLHVLKFRQKFVVKFLFSSKDIITLRLEQRRICGMIQQNVKNFSKKRKKF
jgi:GTPase SAR1 family protein